MKSEAALNALRLLSVRECLETLCASGSDREVGRKALLMAYVVDPELIGTQRDLARRMGVTEGRASQMLKAIRRHSCPNSAPALTLVKG